MNIQITFNDDAAISFTDLVDAIRMWKGVRTAVIEDETALRALLREAVEALEAVELNLPESEIELAREVWGNTNTRILKDVVSRAAELRKKIEEATA